MKLSAKATVRALNAEVDKMVGHKVVNYTKTELPEYVAELLVMGVCSLFLKAGSVEKENSLDISYVTEGFRSLDTISGFSTEEILFIGSDLLHGIYQSEKHCIFAEQFLIEESCIFTDCSISQIRMIFIPAENNRSAEEKIAALLEKLSERGTEEGAGYIEKAVSLLRGSRYGYKALMHRFENLRREVYLCGVK